MDILKTSDEDLEFSLEKNMQDILEHSWKWIQYYMVIKMKGKTPTHFR